MTTQFWRRHLACPPLMLVLAAFAPLPAIAAPGQLELSVVDADTSEPIAVQIQLRHSSGRVVRAPGLPRDGSWQLFDGSTVLRLPPGAYQFNIQRGLEYREATGNFLLKSAAADHHRVTLPRFVKMRDEGWWSGDLDVQPSSLANMALYMMASDLDLLTPTTRDNQRQMQRTEMLLDQARAALANSDRVSLTAEADARDGSVSLLFGARRPSPLPDASQWLPAPFGLVREARQATVAAHLHLTHAACWDLPVWVATGQVDSLGLLHDGLGEQGATTTPRDRPHDRVLYPPPNGMARWNQHVYFQLLEAGLRMGPAAGSGFGRNKNRLGHHRVYVHCGADFSPAAWWDGLRAGRVMVTNGPMLRVRADDQYPGYVFAGQRGKTVELDVAIQLGTRHTVRYLEIIQNARPVQQVRLEDWAQRGGRLPPVVFDSSGWMIVRAVAEYPAGYRGAITGPFYVEYAEQPRISRTAVQFFLDWVFQRARSIREPDPQRRRAILAPHRQARDYWQSRLDQVTVD